MSTSDRRPTGPEFLAAFLEQATSLPPHPTAKPVTGKWGGRVRASIRWAATYPEVVETRRRYARQWDGEYVTLRTWVVAAAYRCEPWSSRTNRQISRFIGQMVRDFGQFYGPAQWPELWR